MGKAVGIDLGTTNSVVAVLEGSHPISHAGQARQGRTVAAQGHRQAPRLDHRTSQQDRWQGAPLICRKSRHSFKTICLHNRGKIYVIWPTPYYPQAKREEKTN